MPASAQHAWAPGPARPRLGADAVHVWRADLAAVTDEMCELLCAQERARAARMPDPEHRRLWGRSRGLLRALLARYLQLDPRALRFDLGEHGKPALAALAAEPDASARSSAQRARLTFNMSHSERTALYAVSHAGAVGVDVEVARRPMNELAIAARLLGDAQARYLEGLEPEARRREFLRAWVRHEAELKCVGVGIGAASGVNQERGQWVAQLELGPHAAGAVAAERPARELRCWDWQT